MATLLIVEDDRKTNEAICEYLKSAGHAIVPAYDGAAALQIFETDPIDLIALDIMLPNITGLAVLHEIRKKRLDSLALLYLIGFAIIIVAVSISSITVMRLKPRRLFGNAWD